ncbi:hypothetical protein B4U80_14808, partial [Leptotrombidium deliense]
FLSGKQLVFYCGGAKLKINELPADIVEEYGHICVDIIDKPAEVIAEESEDDEDTDVAAPEEPFVPPNCAVCLESMQDLELEARVMTHCGHLFCRLCLQNCFDYQQYNCPVCRQSLSGVIEDTYAPAGDNFNYLDLNWDY